MPTETSGAIPLLAQIHRRRLAHRAELQGLVVEAHNAGAAPTSIASVLALPLPDVEALLSITPTDETAVPPPAAHWTALTDAS